MSPFSHWTDVDQGGGSGEEVTEDQEGAPERETEVTFQEREAADLQIREPILVTLAFALLHGPACLSGGGKLRDWRALYRGIHCRQRRRFSLGFWLPLEPS